MKKKRIARLTFTIQLPNSLSLSISGFSSIKSTVTGIYRSAFQREGVDADEADPVLRTVRTA